MNVFKPRINNCLLFILLFIIPFSDAYARNFQIIENESFKILFEPPLRPTADKITETYPAILGGLEKTLGWNMTVPPVIMLIRNNQQFQRMAPHSLAVAFANPRNHSIVIDCTRMSMHPFSLGNTLKHELCHLLLHQHIGSDRLPRWLDEGVCQWTSEWIADILQDQKHSQLGRATVRGRFIPLDYLQARFPDKDTDIILAYEQSRSFVEYIIRKYGSSHLLNVLNRMHEGADVNEAFVNVFSFPLDFLETKWHQSLADENTWLIKLSYYLYEILFGLMALLSLFAFIKIILKKRAYMAAEDDLLS